MERLPWSSVKSGGHGVELFCVIAREVRSLREVLAKQTVRVLGRPALPGTARVAEVDLDAGVDAKFCVLGHLDALVPSERAAQLDGQRRDRLRNRVAHRLGTVSRERRPMQGVQSL